jgi:cellobiose phosphorylase
MPEVKLLSNGSYHVMVTADGSGYSRCNDMAVTRWREDAALDDSGTFFFIRDDRGREPDRRRRRPRC